MVVTHRLLMTDCGAGSDFLASAIDSAAGCGLFGGVGVFDYFALVGDSHAGEPLECAGDGFDFVGSGEQRTLSLGTASELSRRIR